MLQAVAVLIFVDQDAVVGSRDDFADGVDPEGARRATVELIPLLPGLRHAIRRLSHAGESMGVAHAPSSDGIDGDTRVRDAQRSEEHRVGKEWVSKCRARWSPYHKKQKRK